MIKIPSSLAQVVLFCFFAICIYGQQGNKEADNVDHYNMLRQEVMDQKTDSLKLSVIRKALQLAQKNKDTVKIADALYFLSKSYPDQKEVYADRIIDLTKSNPSMRYPAFGYMIKGNLGYELGDYKKALDNYLKGSVTAKENGNELLYFNLRFNIGLLKNTAGERLEAQQIFKDHLLFLDTHSKYKKPSVYNRILFAMVDSYIYSDQLDSAKVYLDKGIKETLQTNDDVMHSLMIVYSGVYDYLSGDIENAIDHLEKGKQKLLEIDQLNTRSSIPYYYLAKCYLVKKDTKRSVQYFEKVDSVLKATEDVIPELIDTYDYLISHYKSEGKIDTQIEHINTLLKFDSILHGNQLYLTKNINEKYDVVELISEKEKLIKQLEEDKFLKQETIVVLILFLVFISLIAIYGFWRSHTNKKRFLEVLEHQKNKERTMVTSKEAIQAKNKTEIDVPEDIVSGVLHKLEEFEKAAKFSEKQYTLNELAKELDTNSTYLSKIINTYKHVNFANYMNNLRIDFAIDQLTKNKALRSYTVEAIALEMGFKKAQSFSTAFHKKTGIYPSYFIKKLNA